MTQFEPLDDGFEELSTTPYRLSRCTQLMVAAIAVLLVVAGGAWWLDHRNRTATITFAGAPIADPGGVLDTATARFDSYTRANAGRLGKDARCWFYRAPSATDVEHTVLCGPVQFYDGAPSKPYLSLSLFPAGSDRPLHLDLGPLPAVPDTVAAAEGIILVRPGTMTSPLATAGIATPVPPPAASNVLTATDTIHPAAAMTSPSSLVGADMSTVQLDTYGPVTAYGSGAGERSAPPGKQLLAFQLSFGGAENSLAPLAQLDLGVAVGNAAPRPLHLGDDTHRARQLFVVAVARDEPVALVLTQNRIAQRLPLRGGGPGSITITFPRPQQRCSSVQWFSSPGATPPHTRIRVQFTPCSP